MDAGRIRRAADLPEAVKGKGATTEDTKEASVVALWARVSCDPPSVLYSCIGSCHVLCCFWRNEPLLTRYLLKYR